MTDEIKPPAPPAPQGAIPPEKILDAPKPKPVRPPAGQLMQAGFIVAIIAFFIGWIPFAGYLGLVAILLGVIGRAQYDREGNAKIFGTLAFGGLAVAAATVWTYLAATASCPHVYTWDGKAWQLDADMLSGSLYRGGESDDVDRLESLAAVDGQYRVRIANDRQERDFVDSAALEIVDHPAGTSALPTPSNEIVLLDEARAPLAARDAKGRDLLQALVAEDALRWQGNAADHDLAREAKPRDSVEVSLPAVQGAAYLVLRTRNTEVATEALYRYLASIGPGVGTLLSLAQRDSQYPYKQRLADELERMGVPMTIEVSGDDGAWKLAHKLKPIGPAALRTVAIPLPALAGKQVRVRLTAVPVAWEIDRVAVASASAATMTRSLVAPRSPMPEVTRLLGTADGQRVEIEQGAHLELAFDAPGAPAAGNTRSLLLHLRGYYDVQIGGRAFINPVALARHKMREDAAAKFFLRSLPPLPRLPVAEGSKD
ncbi:MAG TPA: hypothetical protein VGK67_38340 [Myxococcales bacterium]|jgi:hypothetical protein